MNGRGVLGLLLAMVLGVGCATGLAAGRFPAEQISVPEAADSYSTAPRPDGVVGGRRGAALEREVRSALAERGAPAEADGALADTASWVLHETHQGRGPGPTIVEAAARYFGFAGTAAAFAVFASEGDTWREVLEKIPANLPITRYGIRLSPSGRSAALVVGNVEVSYAPIARAFEPNTAVTLKGEIGPRYRFGHVYFTKPDGTVEEKLLPGRTFDVTFNLTEPGKYQLEVMGDGPTGPHIVSNVPLYVGVPEPPLAGVSGKMINADEAERRLLALLNEARRRAGVKPVAVDDELRTLALAHSEDMVDHDFVSHVSPTTGTPVDRLKRSGILVAAFGENIAKSDTPESAHEGLMGSPGHRATMLKPYFTHVGIGVREQETGLIATMNFGRRVPAQSLPSGAAQVEAAIAALRASKNLPAVRSDPVYSAGAQAGAVALAQGEGEEAVDKAIAVGMQREVDRLRSGRSGSCVYIVDLLELSQLDQAPLSQPAVRAMGVGARVRTDKRGSRLATVIVYDGVRCQ